MPCILLPSKALKDGVVARLGLRLDQRTIALHKRTCTCRYNENQGYYGVLLSLLLHYDTERGLGEEECLKTLSEARNQDILGQDQMKPSLRILIKHHLQRSPCLATTPGTLL